MSTLPFPSESLPRRSLRILCVDDLADIRYVLRLILQHRGHQVTCADDGSEAHTIISDNPGHFDLVITDHQMPVMTGLELVQSLRELQFEGKILIFSSSLDHQVTTAYRELGVDGMLDKPLPPDELIQAIDLVCARTEPTLWVPPQPRAAMA